MRQAGHAAPRTGAPHSLQNLPDVVAPHAGHGTTAEDDEEEAIGVRRKVRTQVHLRLAHLHDDVSARIERGQPDG